ncbi:post-PEP-CTERM-1 domain-containing protein [Pseudoduganella violaceinigra]|uniref:post-PEP-CTERM-1 domain-containing protein n=1 Tax=Pseudoduganella violaceinigra TaxID=246602 RepID=UPI0004220373|nr:hypothetical protein [Pseudoduganella violaceinigra]
MTIKIKSCMLGLALAAALPLHAQEMETEQVAADKMTVVRDAETGKLRAPTAEELAALQPKVVAKTMLRAAVAAPAPRAQLKFHKSGATGARVTNEFMSSAVVVRNADGTLEKQCTDSHEGAEAAAQAGHSHVNQHVTPVTE